MIVALFNRPFPIPSRIREEFDSSPVYGGGWEGDITLSQLAKEDGRGVLPLPRLRGRLGGGHLLILTLTENDQYR